MMQLDMTGNPCPIPVISAKKELAKLESRGVQVLVDNIVAVQNLEKMAKGFGYGFSYEHEGGAVYRVSIRKNDEGAPKEDSHTGGPLKEVSSEEAAPGSVPPGDAALEGASSKSAFPGETLLAEPAGPDNGGITVLITKDRMGSGSDELGKILIKGFIFSLTELPVKPKAVIFLNSGVKLAAEGSNTLADLQALADAGTRVLACGTCLNYYELTEKLAVGEVTDMFGIASRLAAPGKLVSL